MCPACQDHGGRRRNSIVGSTNLDYRSIEYNCELSASFDPKNSAADV